MNDISNMLGGIGQPGAQAQAQQSKQSANGMDSQASKPAMWIPMNPYDAIKKAAPPSKDPMMSKAAGGGLGLPDFLQQGNNNKTASS